MKKFMHSWFTFLFVGFLVLSSGINPWKAEAAAEKAVVKAVLFYSPQCGHCHYVIAEVLPPLLVKYGDQLEILGVDISNQRGNALFRATLELFQVESGGVPFLVVGDTYLMGSKDIPDQFPALIETFLSQGGVDWPDLPGLAEVLAEVQTDPGAQADREAREPAQLPAEEEEVLPANEITLENNPYQQAEQNAIPAPAQLPSPEEENRSIPGRFMRDPAGNSMSLIVLVGMLASLVGVYRRFWRSSDQIPQERWSWLIPSVCLMGFGVAVYLAYVEMAQVEAVCGPVGDCNTVQQSQYALLFGVLPIGFLGVFGYGAMYLAWSLGRYARYPLAAAAQLALFAMALAGTLFSIYLTFLEPFVIGATCAWCLSSAGLMTALLWLSAPGGRRALSLLSRK